jgi:hypothetical protein
MNQLTKLSPAETLVLLDYKKAKQVDLLKVTFMDLILKNVLQKTTIEKQKHPNDPIKTYEYIILNPTQRHYKALPHEEVFLSSFKKNPDIKILFKNMIKLGYQKSPSGPQLIKKVMSSPGLNGAFSLHGFWNRLLGKYHLTSKGVELRKQISSELKELKSKAKGDLSSGIKSIPNDWWMYGGNLFLLTSISVPLFLELDNNVMKELLRQEQTSSDGAFFYSGCSWGTLDQQFHDSGSGCGGDGSGCSGCGGGCGGGD